MRYAVVIDDQIANLIVAEPEWVAQQDNKGLYLPVDDVFGDKNIGSRRLDDGFFYGPQPHPAWIPSGDGRWRPPLERPNPWQHLTIHGDFGTTADQIHIVENVVSNELAAAIVAYCESLSEWSQIVGPNAQKMSADAIEGDILVDESTTMSASDAIAQIIEDVSQLVESTFDVRVHRPRPTLTRMAEGALQLEHCDKVLDYYVYSEEPILDSDLTAVVYYNDDFAGGQLRFPQHEVTIEPKIGMVVIYPSDSFYMHEVLEVTTGVRYTTPLFFSISERP